MDARNAFNSLSRDLAIKTSESLVPQFIQQSETRIRPHWTSPLIQKGNQVHKRTAQGNPIAMAMYGVATLPLLLEEKSLTHKWYAADDRNVAGSFESLRIVLDEFY